MVSQYHDFITSILHETKYQKACTLLFIKIPQAVILKYLDDIIFYGFILLSYM